MLQLLTQKDRLLKLTTPLGADRLIPVGFSGVEALAQPFNYTLKVISADLNIKPEDLLNKPMTLEITGALGKTPRYFNGMVNNFVGGGMQKGMRHYTVTLVPWFALLRHTVDHRIFLGKTVVEIFEMVCKEHKFHDFRKNGISGKHRVHEQNTQYGETTFQFLQRLLEEEGIFYFFQHTKDKHMMILADNTAIHEPCNAPEIMYNDTGGRGQQYAVTQWNRSYQLYSGVHTNTDYNYETASKGLQGEAKGKVNLPIAKNYETYEYATQQQQQDIANDVATRRFQAQQFQHELIHGASDHPGFSAGNHFKLSKHPSKSDLGEYVIYQIRHSASDGSYLAALGEGGGNSGYSNDFTCFPKKIPYTPQQITSRPVIQGPQTATVVGKGEIETDKMGRIQVQFHWVRTGKSKHDKASCWVRVAQPWAGNGRGFWALPRVGDEVVVHFIDGDPDRPLVIGSVYNSDTKMPFGLPANKTQTGIKTESTPDGSGANILRFEDKIGAEEIYIHAEKDFNQKIKHDLSITVDNDYTHETKHDEIHTIGNDITHKTTNNARISVGKDTTQTIGKDLIVNIGETGTIQAGKSLRLIVAGNTVLINAEGIFLNGSLVKVNLS